MSGWTPGPWGLRTDYPICSVGTADEMTAMSYPCDARGLVTEEGRANAHLISAAPDLAEALEYAREQFLEEENPDSLANILVRIDAALAKARGQS